MELSTTPSSFNEFDFLRIHKLLVNTNIDELIKNQICDNIYRTKQKKMSLTKGLKSLTKEKMFKEANYASKKNIG